MLTQLSTVKARLALTDLDVQYDALLTNAIKAITVRFDKETNRALARTVAATHEFSADDTEIILACYPIETVTKFELKTTETEGWIEQTAVDFLIRRQCIISLPFPLSQLSTLNHQLPSAKATYTGGYLLPGSADILSATRLPDDLEQAAVEQVAAWFQNRDKLGLDTIWPHQGTYQKFAQLDLLPPVRAVLTRYTRWTP
jgi:hypothetical protein